MRWGRHNIPELRLVPACLVAIQKICNSKHNLQDININDLAAYLGYTSPKGGAYFRKVSSLESYGLLEYARGTYHLTELAKDLVSVANDEQRKGLYRKAILNVSLWRELYERFPNGLDDNLAAHLKNITGVDLQVAQQYEPDIRRWYTKDISLVGDESHLEEGQGAQSERQKSYILDNINNKQPTMQQPIIQQHAESNGFGTVSVGDIGSVIIRDEDSLAAAEALMTIIKKKVEKTKRVNPSEASLNV